MKIRCKKDPSYEQIKPKNNLKPCDVHFSEFLDHLMTFTNKIIVNLPVLLALNIILL